MDAFFLLGQVLALVGLGYGAWVCLSYAGQYDAESLQADQQASAVARTRAQPETHIVIEPVNRRRAASQTPPAIATQ